MVRCYRDDKRQKTMVYSHNANHENPADTKFPLQRHLELEDAPDRHHYQVNIAQITKRALRNGETTYGG